MTRRDLLLRGGYFAAGLIGAPTLPLHAGQDSTYATVFGPRLQEPATPPRNDAWRVVGPGGGGAQFKPSISPHDPNLVLVTCDMGGVYLSVNGGNLWRMINLGGVAHNIVFDPLDAAVIYIATSMALCRSEDRGRTWSLFLEKPGARFTYVGDEAEAHVEEPELGLVRSLAVDPSDSNRLYLAVGKTLYASKDRGRHCAEIAQWDAPCLKLFVDPYSPPNRRTIYGIGQNWVAVLQGSKIRGGGRVASRKGFLDTAIAFREGAAPAVYATVEFEPAASGYAGGLIVSRDGGAGWQALNEGIMRLADTGSKPPVFAAIACSPTDPSNIYLSYSGLISQAQQWLGVARSVDGGKTWTLPLKNGAKYPGNMPEAWLGERYNPGWTDGPIGLAVGPKDPNLCYGTDAGRTIRTSDGGRSWQQLYTQSLEEGGYTTTGLDVTGVHSVQFDPFDSKRIFLACTDVGLFRSENGGRSWFPSNYGSPGDWQNTTYSVAFDPDRRGLMWAAMSGIHDLPRAKMCCDFPSWKGGICISRDGGRHWAVSGKGMDQTAPTHILLDPASPSGRRVLYVAGYSRGVYKSVDGGETWQLKNQGIEGENPLAWRLARDPNGVLYLVVGRHRHYETLGAAGDGALYTSLDGAGTWIRLPLPKGFNGPNGIAIDPENPRRIYLAGWARWGRNQLTPADGGILLSEDGGRQWRRIFAEDQHIFDITIDPSNPAVLYAAGFECSIWRSSDRGATWNRIPGFNFRAAQRIVTDPNRPGFIYVATFGGGAWYGPASGDPSAVEDVVTPPSAFHRTPSRRA